MDANSGNPTHNRSPMLFPLLLIGAGVIFLLNNTGVLPWNVWGQIWKLWPLILIAVGLEILIGRRNPVLAFLIVVVALVVGAGVIYAGGGLTRSSDVVQMPLSVPLGSAKSADVIVDMGAGDLKVDGAVKDDSLLATGTLEYFESNKAPKQEINTVGNKVELKLTHQNENSFNIPLGNKGGANWEIHLNPTVSIGELNVSSGAGNNTLNLERMKVGNFAVSYGAGNIEVTLPDTGDVSGEISSGAGNIEVVIPEGVAARINASSGLGNVEVDSAYTDVGKGVYESKGYASAKDKVELNLHTGLGNISVKLGSRE